MGAPPHGGFALGLERFVALLAGEQNIREVVAFPKTSSGSEPMTGAPTPIAQEILARARNPDAGPKGLARWCRRAPIEQSYFCASRRSIRRTQSGWHPKGQREHRRRR